MKLPRVLFAVLAGLMGLLPSLATADVYELRTYTTNPGKLENLNARFRDHTVGLFEKHGMESVGYWVPLDKPLSENTLIYVLKHESREAAKASWAAFLADPDWQKAARESEKDGKILAKAPEAIFMDVADYNPEYANPEKPQEQAVFELRIYRTNEGKLPNLDSRFRDHTMRLFKRHGMTNVAYWHPTDEPTSKDTLIYILRYDSRESAAKSWEGFRADEEWKKVAAESQKDGQFLRERPESIYMKATDYSAIK